jgi:hypothetical protein
MKAAAATLRPLILLRRFGVSSATLAPGLAGIDLRRKRARTLKTFCMILRIIRIFHTGILIRLLMRGEDAFPCSCGCNAGSQEHHHPILLCECNTGQQHQENAQEGGKRLPFLLSATWGAFQVGPRIWFRRSSGNEARPF